MSRYKIRLQPGAIVLFFAALVIAYLTVVPLAMLVYGSFKSSPPGVAGHFTLDHYAALFQRPEMIRSIRNSLVFGLGTSLLAFAGGVYLAWVTERTNMILLRKRSTAPFSSR